MVLQRENVAEVKLVKPAECYAKGFLSAHHEFLTAADKRAWVYLPRSHDPDLPKQNFSEFVALLQEYERNPFPGFVTTSTYWALWQDQVVGRVGIRHQLNDFLKRIGGHVGYIVRPSARRKGVATKMLELALKTPELQKIGRILVTCDADNVASEKTILKNGGVFENQEPNPGHPDKKRFWIDVRGQEG